MNRLFRKLNSTKGESISETLISGLVIALGFIIAVTMIVSASNMVSKADKDWTAYYNSKNMLEARNTAAPASESPAAAAEGTLTLTPEGAGATGVSEPITIYISADGSLADYVRKEAEGNP